jgi:hypothetical protein
MSIGRKRMYAESCESGNFEDIDDENPFGQQDLFLPNQDNYEELPEICGPMSPRSFLTEKKARELKQA